MVIYVDSSVLLAQILAEDRKPPASFWAGDIASSQLATYEVWTRLNRGKLAEAHRIEASNLLAGCDLLELSPRVLERALAPFPVRVRTLDALHLASVEHLRLAQPGVTLATYDRRMSEAARAMDVPLWEEAP